MSRSKGARRCFTAVCVMWLILASAPWVSAADPYVPPSLLSAEARDVAAFGEIWAGFDRRADALRAKGRVARTEIDALQGDADAIKRAAPGLQRAFASVVAKLKGAGKWTPQLDAFGEERLRASAATLQALRASGGARTVLERAISAAGQIGIDADSEVTALRGKSAAQRLLELVLGVPAEGLSGTSCYALTGGAIVSCSLGEGTKSCQAYHQWVGKYCRR